VGLEVVEAHEVGVLQVEALGDAAQLHLAVGPQHLEGHFLAAVADAEIHLAEAAPADAALQGVAVQRSLSRTVRELHGTHPREERSEPEAWGRSRREPALTLRALTPTCWALLPHAILAPTGSIAKAKSSPVTAALGPSRQRSWTRCPSTVRLPA